MKNLRLTLPIIRYATVVLGLAEALNEQGKTAEAIEQVNLVRERAGVALLNSNAATQVNGQDDMRTRIQNEYRWETAGEVFPSMKKCVGKPGKKASSTTLTVLPA